jgi:hypothetical protein
MDPPEPGMTMRCRCGGGNDSAWCAAMTRVRGGGAESADEDEVRRPVAGRALQLGQI